MANYIKLYIVTTLKEMFKASQNCIIIFEGKKSATQKNKLSLKTFLQLFYTVTFREFPMFVFLLSLKVEIF